MQPHQIISLMEMGGPTLAMADHADHIHVGFQPLFGPNEQARARSARRLLSNNQWDRFVARLTDIENPVVRTHAVEVLDQGRSGTREPALERRPRRASSRPRLAAGQLFRFCQLDFPFALGPADGRYLRARRRRARTLDVVVFATLARAARAAALRGAPRRRAEPSEPRAGAGRRSRA